MVSVYHNYCLLALLGFRLSLLVAANYRSKSSLNAVYYLRSNAFVPPRFSFTLTLPTLLVVLVFLELPFESVFGLHACLLRILQLGIQTCLSSTIVCSIVS